MCTSYGVLHHILTTLAHIMHASLQRRPRAAILPRPCHCVMRMNTALPCLFRISLQCAKHILLFTDAQPWHDGSGHCKVVPVQSRSVSAKHILLFTDAQPFHDAPLTRCRLRRGTRHNGVRCMVFIDPATSVHVGTMGHVSSHSLHAH